MCLYFGGIEKGIVDLQSRHLSPLNQETVVIVSYAPVAKKFEDDVNKLV